MAFIPLIKPTEEQEVTDVQMAAFAAVANHLAKLGIGLHCAMCQQDLRGVNDITDQAFAVKCSCREFRSKNPRVKYSADFHTSAAPAS